MRKKISALVPVYNEKENITECVDRLEKALKGLEYDYEIICTDDGSADGSGEMLKSLAGKNKNIKVIQFKKNYGQTAAMAAGFDFAEGEIVVTLDADLQNEPEDIPKLIGMIEKGYDVVCGWRKNRRDKLLTRKMPSFIANKVISFVTGVKLHDYGCTLKAYKKEYVKDIKLYGEMHRFLPALLSWAGAKIAEVEVRHAPRLKGKSKYGIFRTFKVSLDLLTVKLLTAYSTKPIYLFGGIGLVLLALGAVTFLVVAYRAIIVHNISATPLVFIMVILFISGIQMILTGLLAEINIRTFFETKNKETYKVKEKINISASASD